MRPLLFLSHLGVAFFEGALLLFWFLIFKGSQTDYRRHFRAHKRHPPQHIRGSKRGLGMPSGLFARYDKLRRQKASELGLRRAQASERASEEVCRQMGGVVEPPFRSQGFE